MTWLAYAVCNAGPDFRTLPPLRGVENRPVEYVKTTRLAVAVSRISKAEPPLDMAALKRYQAVVEDLFQKTDLIPLRYGSLFDTRLAVLEMLDQSGPDHATLLENLRGCAEMGIRVMVPDSAEQDTPPVAQPDTEPIGKPGTGAAYLDSRRARYRQKDGHGTGQDQLIQHWADVFSPLSRHWYLEKQPGTSKSPGLFFLVPKQTIPAFRDLYRDRAAKAPAKSFLSGPWPPYNFVTPESGLLRHSAASLLTP